MWMNSTCIILNYYFHLIHSLKVWMNEINTYINDEKNHKSPINFSYVSWQTLWCLMKNYIILNGYQYDVRCNKIKEDHSFGFSVESSFFEGLIFEDEEVLVWSFWLVQTDQNYIKIHCNKKDFISFKKEKMRFLPKKPSTIPQIKLQCTHRQKFILGFIQSHKTIKRASKIDVQNVNHNRGDDNQ